MIPSGIGRCSRIRRDGDSRVWASRDWRPPEDPGTTEVHCNKNRRCVALIRRECCIGYRGFPQGPGRRTHSSLTPVASYARTPLPYRPLQRLSSRVPSGAHSGVHHLDPSRRNGANGPDPKPVSRNLGPPNKSVPPGNKLGTGTSPRNKNPVTCNHDRTHLDQSLRSSQKNRNSPTLIRESQEYPPRGEDSKTRVHGICFIQMRVPPPQNKQGGGTLIWLKTRAREPYIRPLGGEGFWKGDY